MAWSSRWIYAMPLVVGLEDGSIADLDLPEHQPGLASGQLGSIALEPSPQLTGGVASRSPSSGEE